MQWLAHRKGVTFGGACENAPFHTVLLLASKRVHGDSNPE